MSNYCGYCGTATQGARFCGNCGQATGADPVARPAAPLATPRVTQDGGPASHAPAADPQDRTVRRTGGPAHGEPPEHPRPGQPMPAPDTARLGASPWTAGPHGPTTGPYAPPHAASYTPPGRAPARSVENPFALTPLTDYARDVGAVACLFSVLGMTWDFSGGASDRWWVVVGVLVAVLGLPLPYLGRSRLVPGVTAQHVRWAKAAMTAPLWVGIAAALVNELVHVADDFEGGVGSGVAMAAAGALLVAQPRSTDETSDPRGGRGWLWGAAVSAVTVAVAVPLGFAAFVLSDALGAQFVVTTPLALAGVAVASVVTLSVAVSWPALASLRSGAAWKRVLGVTGFATLAVLLVSQGDWISGEEVAKWSYPGSASLLLGVAAPLAVSRPVQRVGTHDRDRAADWLGTAAAALTVAALVAGLGAVQLVLLLLQFSDVDAATVVVVVLLVASAVLLTVAAALVGRGPGPRVAVLCLVPVQLLLAVVSLSVVEAEGIYFSVSAVFVAVLLSLPVLALVALTAPPSVRRGLGPLVAARPTSPAGYQ